MVNEDTCLVLLKRLSLVSWLETSMLLQRLIVRVCLVLCVLCVFCVSWCVSKVTLLEAGASVGGLVAGWKTPGGRSVEAGVHG